MKPIFKYSGGKTRELKRIDKIIDGLSFERIIEPFAGGCAFAFSQEKPSIISDIRHNNIDVYKTVKDKSQFDILLQKVEETKQITDKKELEKLFKSTKNLRKEIVDAGQDINKPDFGRKKN